mmetsp:Transcript_4629/g.15408  ORF Transcript_4629/g.15408 Transcript_4629/m.15408 type:complete len:252 (+) Transcript_4629:422-1177(+)
MGSIPPGAGTGGPGKTQREMNRDRNGFGKTERFVAVLVWVEFSFLFLSTFCEPGSAAVSSSLNSALINSNTCTTTSIALWPWCCTLFSSTSRSFGNLTIREPIEDEDVAKRNAAATGGFRVTSFWNVTAKSSQSSLSALSAPTSFPASFGFETKVFTRDDCVMGSTGECKQVRKRFFVSSVKLQVVSEEALGGCRTFPEASASNLLCTLSTSKPSIVSSPSSSHFVSETNNLVTGGGSLCAPHDVAAPTDA